MTYGNSTQAWADRHNLARDIFARLIVATGAAANVDGSGNVTVPPNITPGMPEFNALQYLAQIAVNIVDYIDNDDISTPFIWFPRDASGNPAPLTVVTDPKTLQGSIAKPAYPPGSKTPITPAVAVQQQMVFGVEKPRVVINEAYSEITNDPNEQTNGPFTGRPPMRTGPTLAAHVRFWVELVNPTNTPYAPTPGGPANPNLAINNPLGDGSAQLYYPQTTTPTTPATTIPAFSPYNLVITRVNRTKGQLTGNLDPTFWLNPSNVTGALASPAPSPSFMPFAPDISFDFSTATAAGQGAIPVNNGAFTAPGALTTGFALVGPTINNGGPGAGPQPSEFNPPTTGAWKNSIKATAPTPPNPLIKGAAGATPNPLNAMEYIIPAVTSGTTTMFPLNDSDLPDQGNTTLQDFQRGNVIVLRRLANPYLPLNDPTNDPSNPVPNPLPPNYKSRPRSTRPSRSIHTSLSITWTMFQLSMRSIGHKLTRPHGIQSPLPVEAQATTHRALGFRSVRFSPTPVLSRELPQLPRGRLVRLIHLSRTRFCSHRIQSVRPAPRHRKPHSVGITRFRISHRRPRP